MRQARKRTRYSVLRGGACDGAIRWLKDDARSTRDIAQTVLGLLCSSSLRGRPPSTGEHGRTNFSASIAAMDRLLCRWPRCLGKGKNVRHYLYIVADAQRSGDAVPLVFDIERSNGRGRVRTMHARKLWLQRSGSQSCEAQGDLIMPSTKLWHHSACCWQSIFTGRLLRLLACFQSCVELFAAPSHCSRAAIPSPHP